MGSSTSRLLGAGKLPGNLLSRLISQYRTPSDDAVLVEAGYGFDAAAVSIGGETLLVKSDPITFATEEAPRYLVAVNANDIACMGGIPRWMTVVALLPEGATTADGVEQLFAELQKACIAAGVSLIGGHTEITLGLDRPLLIGTMLGTPGPTGMLQPGKASAGDELYLTKWIGLEGSALIASQHAGDLVPVLGQQCVETASSFLHDPGISIVRDAEAVLSSGAVTALHDPTEGGLATALHEMAEASGLGALLDHDSVPIRSETRKISNHYGIDPLGLISSGALLIAAKPGSEQSLKASLASTGIPLAKIGVLTDPSDGLHLTSGDDSKPLPRYDSDELTRVLS